MSGFFSNIVLLQITRKNITTESRTERSFPSLNNKMALNKSMGPSMRKLGDYDTGQLPKTVRDE